MAGEVTAVIDLCTLVAEVGLKAYDAAQKISTNFEEERNSLGERVKEMSQRVERLREELEKDQTHNLKGIHLKEDNFMRGNAAMLTKCFHRYLSIRQPTSEFATCGRKQARNLKISVAMF